MNKAAGLLSPLSFRSSLLLMLVAGGLNFFSFAPFHFWPVQVFGMALLFALLLREGNTSFSRRQSGWLAWTYSLGWLSGCVSWLVYAMSVFGGLPWILSALALLFLTGALSLYFAVAAYVTHTLRRRWKLSATMTGLLLLPALFTVAEWLRIWLLTGFPWTISGYAHTHSTLAGYAPVIGALGLCWISALLSVALALLPHPTVNRPKKISLVVLLLAVFLGGAALQQVEWTRPQGEAIQVRLLQGNVAQNMKFDQDHLNDSLALYHDMVMAAPADLIVTPETALPMLSSQLPPDYLPALNTYMMDNNSTLILGLGVHDGGDRYSNSVLGFSRQYGNQPYRYDKHHLVPFGEFIPPGFRWFVKLMSIPMGEFSTSGPIQPAMKVAGQWVMPNICYEDLFGEEIAAQLSAQHAAGQPVASILLNVSNLAWYGNSFAIPQHLQISQMRVMETGRPMLRSTNTGATAYIVPGGKVEALLPENRRDTLSVKVQGRTGLTPYILVGNWGVLGIIGLSLMLAFFRGRTQNRPERI